MAQSAVPFLITHFGDQWIRGSEVVLLDLLDALDRTAFEPIVWCNGRELAELCRSRGITTYVGDMQFFFDYERPAFRLFELLSQVRLGTQICKRHQVKFIHCNGAAPMQWLAFVAAKVAVPILVHLHIKYLPRSRVVLLLRNASLLVAVSHDVLNEMLSDGFPRSRSQVIYNGVNTLRLACSGQDFRSRLGISETSTVILSIGSLVHRKGHDVLLAAFARSKPCQNQLHLIIAPNNGDTLAFLVSLSDRLKISDRVHFVPYQANVGDLFACADIFALASRNESFGLVLVEAALYSLPACSTRVGGIPEVVIDGETGLLVEPDDIEALADAIRRLVSDAGVRRRLGSNARDRAQRHFTVKSMAIGFQSAYLGLLARPARPSRRAIFANLSIDLSKLIIKRLRKKPSRP